MTIIRLIPVLCLLVLSACKDPMKNYYTDSDYKTPGADKNVMQELTSNPDYSTFVSLLKDTGMDKELFGDGKGNKSTLYTLWIPLNEDMPAEVLTLTPEEKRRLIQNHISVGVLNTYTLDKQIEEARDPSNITMRTPVVMNESGRHMPVQNKSGIYYIDGAELLNVDNVCADGIIQEISEWFLPRLTLYDYIMSLDESYSVYKDSLLGRDIYIFDKDSSVENTEHVDEDGNPIWDSVYIKSNNILDYARLENITSTYTVFIPTNEAIAGMYRDMSNYLMSANYPISSADTSRWMDWLMRMTILSGQQQYRPNQEWSTSLWNPDYYVNPPEDEEGNSLWERPAIYTFRTDFQDVYNTEPTKCLNGWAYQLDKIRVPKTMYLADTNFNPWRIRERTGGMNTNLQGLDWWSNPLQIDMSLSGPKGSRDDAVIQFGRAGYLSDGQAPAYYGYQSMRTIFQDGKITGLEPLPILPGYYDIGIRLAPRNIISGMTNKTDSVLVKINGAEFKVKYITTGRYNTADENLPYLIRGFYITGEYEPAKIEIHMYPVDPSITDDQEYRAYRQLSVGITKLKPTESVLNYQ